MLFDLQADPGEQRNVAPVHPAVVTRLLESLDAWSHEMAAPLWPRVMNYRFEDEGGTYWFAI